MKNIFKIAAVVLITFAVASNLYAATFSFYGIKTSKLSNSVVAAAMSASSGGSSDDGSTTYATSTSAWWDSPVNRVIDCGETRVAGGETSAGTAGASVNTVTNAAGEVSVKVTYANMQNSNYTQVIPAHQATMRQCIGPNLSICTNISAIEACK